MQLREYIRKAEFEDIMFEIEQIEQIRKMDDRNYYDVDWKPWADVIKQLNQRCRRLIAEYDAEYGVKIPVNVLKRLMRS